MHQSKHIKYFEYGWDMNDYREIFNFASKQRKRVKMLSYGCDLDYKLIHNLIKKHLVSKVETENETSMEISFDSYDANIENQALSDYFFKVFYVDENRLLEFEKDLHQLTGKHIQCNYNIRGHFEVQLNGKQFSTLVYKTLDCSAIYREAIEGQYLFFIDTESEDNIEIRHKMHLLPSNLQSLNLPVNFSEIQKEVYVKDWIRSIIAY
ncbi:hypothetical protein KD050_01770 [Psychrobacillus sp. INOP01]|uniref:hypothetical protein n=1 Tax=Psychrobacillus sp. INOP01 TaxID=2829187 RepID=UPI001BA57D55|nr:hypothetical protein [Psychrobacillus sp. INOP01]QUG42053.1 hypothetical protein KD050_01770 [Psychrobacillus sp. INOP01]